MKEIPTIIKQFREANKGKSNRKLVDTYYNFIDIMREAKRQHDEEKVNMYAMVSLSLIEPLIKSTIKECGEFILKSIPAIEISIRYHTKNKNMGQLKNLKDIIYYFPELDPWKNRIDKAFKKLERG